MDLDKKIEQLIKEGKSDNQIVTQIRESVDGPSEAPAEESAVDKAKSALRRAILNRLDDPEDYDAHDDMENALKVIIAIFQDDEEDVEDIATGWMEEIDPEDFPKSDVDEFIEDVAEHARDHR